MPACHCRFSRTGHVDLNITNFQFFQEGKDAAKPNLDNLGFFITPTQTEGMLELDLAQVVSISGTCPSPFME